MLAHRGPPGPPGPPGDAGAAGAAGAAATLTTKRTGKYLSLTPGINQADGGVFTLNRVMYLPVMFGADISLDRMGIWVAAGTVNAVVRFGLYAADGAGNWPGTLLNDFGTVAAATATTFAEVTIAKTLTGGTGYWAAAVTQVANPTSVGRLLPLFGPSWPIESPVTGASGILGSLVETGVSGALANAGTITVATSINTAIIYGRAA